jgi:hypothetical protein
MMRSFAVGFERIRMLVVFLGVVGGLLLVADRAAADEPEFEDNPPEIVAGEVTPSNLSFEGGNVQISADVVDDIGVSMVSATIYGPNGFQAIQLFQGNENTYFGTLEVPANFSEFEVGYSVEIQAYDTNNAFVASLIGGVQVEAAPQFDEFPYVNEAQLTPPFLPSTGGTVTISAEAGDNRGLSAVFATVATLNGTTEVPLQPISSSRFEGTFTAPPNPGPLADEYVVEVIAQDDIGQETRVSAGIITVEPPLVPSLGRLRMRPASRSFGSVRIGKAARRLVFVRNVPRRKGEPVEATVQIVGSTAFSLPGLSSYHFVLGPGERKAFLVEFRPTVAGSQSASLEIVRDDGGQPGLAVGLSGSGRS